MTISLPTLDPLLFAGACVAIVIISCVAHLLEDRPHKLFVIAISVAVTMWIDWIATLLLLAYAHVAYSLIRREVQPAILSRVAWAGVALLMGYKVAQSALGGSGSLYVLIGVSYFTFRISSTLFDAARKRLGPITYSDYLNYAVFFPIFAGGPVQRYQTFQRTTAEWDRDVVVGMLRLGRGILKKIVIADIVLLFLIETLRIQLFLEPDAPAGPQGFLSVKELGLSPLLLGLLFGFANILRAYVDLSAFTDIALGSGRLFGYRIAENFDRPFLATNIIDFWRRWHLTIAAWARDYIFSPLAFGSRNLPLAVLATMVAMGLWHEVSAVWLFWGLAHGAGLIICGFWQRTAASIALGRARLRLRERLRRSFDVDLPVGLFPGRGAGRVGVLEGRMVRVRLGNLAAGIVDAVFPVLAWSITFGYMSLVFVAVSVENGADALRAYAAMLGI